MNTLQQLILLEHDAREFGFDWPNIDMILDQAISECDEIKDALAQEEPDHRIQEEIGDLLHTAVSMCIFAGFDVEETLHYITKKFGARLKAVKSIAAQQGYTSLKGQSIDFLMELWRQAKKCHDKQEIIAELTIRLMIKDDISRMANHFASENWSKASSTFEHYFHEQQHEQRLVWLAFYENEFAGYITLKWHSDYPSFNEQNIPEIKDLNVLPYMQEKGIGSALLNTAERAAAEKSKKVGLGIGLYAGYGNALNLYTNRGYVSDGLGLTYQYERVKFGEKVPLNDDLLIWWYKKLKP